MTFGKGDFHLVLSPVSSNPIFSQISIFVTSRSSSLLGWEFAVTSDLDCLDQQLFPVNYQFGESNITQNFQFLDDRSFHVIFLSNKFPTVF